MTKAIVAPSGDQAGWVGRSEGRSAASRTGSDPSSAIVYTNQSSPARAEKAMEDPSGDQLGSTGSTTDPVGIITRSVPLGFIE